MSVVGIDLGTTNTVVACVKMGRVHVIADEHGNRLLPSVVSFHPSGQVLVGREAKARLGIDGKNTIASVKRLIGRSWHSEELIKARQRFPFDMREGPGQGPLILARGQEYTLPEISAFILKKAKQIAEAALGTPVDKAVITVPAHFNELQRASTKVAGRVAGLEVLRILNEPTAAALAYGLGRQNNERIVVYDFGGGTFDCTLLDLSGSVFEVLASAGDTFLGGDDVDAAIADRMCEAFLHQYRYDPRSDNQALTRLKLAAEHLKIELSQNDQAQVRLREIAYGVGGAHLDMTFGFSRAELEALVDPLVERSFKVTQDAMSLARLTPSAFDHVILVGGTTRIPRVRKRVEQFFGMPPLDRVNPDEVVAIGAAIQAAALSDQLRRRSIPPPPDNATTQTMTAARAVPPTQHIPTQRGLADVSLRSGPVAEQTAMRGDTTVRVDANADPFGNDETLSMHKGQASGADAKDQTANARTLTAPPQTAPLAQTLSPNTAPVPTGPMSRTLPLDAQAPNADRSIATATAPPGTARLPGAPIPPAAGRPPRSIPAPPLPRTVTKPGGVRPSAPPVNQGAPPLPPARAPSPIPPKAEDPSMTQEFPDPNQLPTPFGSWQPSPSPAPVASKPIPPPPKPGAAPKGTPPPRTQVPSSGGLGTFGAIDDLPSIHSTSGASLKVPSLPGQPSPIGDESPFGSPLGGPQPPNRPAPYVPTAASPQFPFAPPQQPPSPQVELARPGGIPYGVTQQSPAAPDLRPPGMPMPPPGAPGLGPLDILPPAVGGFSVAPAQGAAPVLVDVTPRALVVEVVGGYCDTIIPRNAKIPCERTRQFTTGSDYQTVVRVRVAQGEHAQFMQNTYLGEVELSGLRPATRGEVSIGVTFELDADGSLRVRATDVATGQEAVATLQLVGLATDESSIVMMIDRMAQQQIAH